MAVEQRYTEQFPFVGTRTQRDRVEDEARKRRTSLAEIIRDALDNRYGLVDGEVPDGPGGTTAG